ncbi:NADH:flavin oxidoreductase / NADH oxidase family protein [marine gamma proteobacterium HTCC2080]|nr:NADH:flavin oxidoreductase / NADH oxidase family protein [marine gamma proteobacterium HTCC2080]
MTAQLSDALTLNNGAQLKNRFMLAPLTNLQSGADGVLSDDEYHWLTYRAEGGFGLTMTCAASVQHSGVGFPGQLGAHDDRHISGLTRLAAGIKAHNSHAVVQLQHSGMRSQPDYCSGVPQCPSDDEETGSKAMSDEQVQALINDFIAAAERCQKAGFDGVELHGAHGYLLSEFLSPQYNQRDDQYGGNAENRAQILWEVIAGVNERCGRDFSLGVRLSPERFGQRTAEIRDLAAALLSDNRLDYLDMSLWDLTKPAHDEEFEGQSLLEIFTQLPREGVALGAAGKLYSAAQCQSAIDQGLDFVMVGRGGILHHDFPERALADPEFIMADLPVTREYLKQERLGPPFIDYMASWKGFVAD